MNKIDRYAIFEKENFFRTLFTVGKLTQDNPVNKTEIYENITGKKSELRSINNRLTDLNQLGLITLKQKDSFGNPWEVQITEKGAELIRKLEMIFDETKEIIEIPKERVIELKAQGISSVDDFAINAFEEKFEEFMRGAPEKELT